MKHPLLRLCEDVSDVDEVAPGKGKSSVRQDSTSAVLNIQVYVQ
jgi:hypothetical protein